MKKRIVFLIGMAGSLFSGLCHAENLLDAYRQGLRSDPTFKTAEAQWQATQELVPIGRSYLLPQFTTNGQINRSYYNQTFDGSGVAFYQNNGQYALNLSQAIFNYAAWSTLKYAKAQVKQGFATYNAAAQSLMLRVATAYLGVLQAYDQLLATQAQKRSLGQQLQQTEDQYKVGLIAITGVEQVRASYDATLATEIANKNAIANNLEQLRAITGVFYNSMTGVTAKLPLVPPRPENINQWVNITTKQSYAVKAAYYGMVAAKQNVSTQRAGHFPVIDATANYTNQSQSEASLGGFITGANQVQTTALGLTANFPVYQGGLVSAQTRQAAAQYGEAAAQLDYTYRSTLTQARESYLGVMSGISKLKADRQAIVSSQSSLNSTKAAYTAGTATIVDVLQQQSDLYNAQNNYANDQYNYLISILTLKQAAGTLCPEDLAMVNSWLTIRIDFSPYNFNVKPIAYSEAEFEKPAVVSAPVIHHKKAKKPAKK